MPVASAIDPDSHHVHWMRLALQQARQAAAVGEVPVGAVVVQHGPQGDVLLAQAHNRTQADHDPCAHAEVLALRAAARQVGNHRLYDCSLYVTVEPCSMCSGAVFQARLRQVVYGCAEPRMGVAGSVLNLYANATLNHHTQIAGGVLADECAALMQTFFATQRQRNQEQQRRHALRDDALRTPDRCFARCDPPAPEGSYTLDWPALQGMRLHALDNRAAWHTIAPDAPLLLCLHPLWHWSAYWHELLAVAGQSGVPVLAPDLPGWGRSDKPKKVAWHTPAVQVDVLARWLTTQRVSPRPVVLLAQGLNLPLALGLARHPAVADAIVGVLLRDSPEITFSAHAGWAVSAASQQWMQAVAKPGKAPDWSQQVRHWLPHAPEQTDPAAWAWLDAPFPDAGHRAGPRALSGWFDPAQPREALQNPVGKRGPLWRMQRTADFGGHSGAIAVKSQQSDAPPERIRAATWVLQSFPSVASLDTRLPVVSLPPDAGHATPTSRQTVWHNLLTAAHALC